jgi:hypothetical protein
LTVALATLLRDTAGRATDAQLKRWLLQMADAEAKGDRPPHHRQGVKGVADVRE